MGHTTEFTEAHASRVPTVRFAKIFTMFLELCIFIKAVPTSVYFRKYLVQAVALLCTRHRTVVDLLRDIRTPSTYNDAFMVAGPPSDRVARAKSLDVP